MIQITDIGGDKREFYRPVRLCNTQHALKGQKLLAQGSALGIMAIGKAPCFTLIEQALSAFFNVNYV